MDLDLQKHAGHRGRLRQRVQQDGLFSLEPHEIIEFLLYYCIPRQNVNALAHALIDSFGSVRGVLDAEIPDLMRVPGIGRSAAEWLALVGECALACARTDLDDCEIQQNYTDTFRHLCSVSSRFPPPSTVMLCLDMEFRLIYERELCPSRAWGEETVLREALGDVLSLRAKNVILIEFTGSVSPEPDEYDREHARDLSLTLRASGCELLDVLLSGDGGTYSMFQHGDLPGEPLKDSCAALREEYRKNVPEDLEDLRILSFREKNPNDEGEQA